MSDHLDAIFELFPPSYNVIRRTDCDRAIHQSFVDYPTPNLYHITKDYPKLMKDALHGPRWRDMDETDQVALLWSLYRAAERRLQAYDRGPDIGPMEERALHDAAMLKVVESQLYDYPVFAEMSTRTHYAASPLWKAYKDVYVRAGGSLRRTIELICAADTVTPVIRGTRSGTLIMAPSTVVGGGCGVVAVGRAEQLDHEYLGPIVSAAVVRASSRKYYVSLDDERSLDGSRVFSFATYMNSPPAGAKKEHICQFQTEPTEGKVYAHMGGPVTSAEVWSDYGMSLAEFDS